jgi:hypothetical protein
VLSSAERGLATEAEFLGERSVSRHILASEKGQQAASLSHELQQPASRMIVLFVRLQMLCQPFDALGEERDLDFG